MKRFYSLFCSAILFGSLSVAQPHVSAAISSVQTLTLEAIADLQAKVQANPDDVASRSSLLMFYTPYDPSGRFAQLENLLYLIEHHPDLSVFKTAGAHAAGEADHAAVRNAWLAAADSHSGNTRVIVNAARFLSAKDKSDAEDVLHNAMAAHPEDREIAVNLGFLYAMEILRLDELSMGARPSDSGPDLSGHAKDELAASSNAVVLAAAGTALPNLAKAALNPAIFELASRLAAGARQLAPGDPDIQGPMPLIRYFKLATGQALPPPHKIVRPK